MLETKGLALRPGFDEKLYAGVAVSCESSGDFGVMDAEVVAQRREEAETDESKRLWRRGEKRDLVDVTVEGLDETVVEVLVFLLASGGDACAEEFDGGYYLEGAERRVCRDACQVKFGLDTFLIVRAVAVVDESREDDFTLLWLQFGAMAMEVLLVVDNSLVGCAEVIAAEGGVVEVGGRICLGHVFVDVVKSGLKEGGE